MKKEITSSSDEGESNEGEKNGETLVGVVHSGGQETTIDSRSSSLGLDFYHEGDNGEFAGWLKDYHEWVYDVMVTSNYKWLSDEMDISRSEEYSLLEPCELLTEEEWLQRRLTPWINGMDAFDVSLVHADGTQGEKAMLELAKLEEPLHLKTTSTGIVVAQDVKDYPKVLPNWYRKTEEQIHVSEVDWKYVDVKMRDGKAIKMKMGSKLKERKIKQYSELVDEFSVTFAWSYDELKGIPQEMVEHRITLVPGARPNRQKKRRMNPQL